MKRLDTPAQRARQHRRHRSVGKYAKVNPCDACGNSAGVDYYSDPRHEQHNGFGLCLCQRCADKMADMNDFQYAEAAGSLK
jgi:hypothetical protein